MTTSFLVVIVGLFLTLLFLNIYFRIKVLKLYKILVKNKVEFGSSHILSETKLRREILHKYPELESEIIQFTQNIRRSMQIAICLVVLIAILAWVVRSR